MTDRIDLREEFLAGFVAEAEEHLATAAEALLALAGALDAGRAEPRAVRRLFRALHTVKGLAGMVDVAPLVDISHAMESLVRRAEQAGGRLPHEGLDLLGEGLREMDARVRAMAAGEGPPDAPARLVAALDAQAVTPPAGEAPALRLEPSVADKLGASEREQIAQGLAGGLRLLRVDFEPSTERAATGITISTVRARIESLGEIVRVVPLARPDAPGGIVFTLLLLTSATPGELAAAASLEPAAVGVASGPAGPEEPEEEGLPPEGGALGGGADEALEAGEPAVASEPAAPPAGAGHGGAVRVAVPRLDEAVDRLSDAVVGRLRLGREVDRLAADGVDVRELSTVLQEHERQLRALRQSIMRLRLVPVSQVLARVPLIVRGLSRATGKAVRVELDAGRAEIDKAVGDRVFPAVLQLVRNAVDHAIERPEIREAAGKPETGRIRVAAFDRHDGRLELTVEDDGAGVDRAAVAARAEVDPETLDDPTLLSVLTRPSFSTREVTTATSGRGVGLDVVRRIAEEELGGELHLHTEPGRGTRFRVVVPLSLTIVDVLAFTVAGQRFVAPVSTVEELLEVGPEQVVAGPRPLGASGGARLVRTPRGAVPLLDLGDRLGLPGGGDGRRKALLVRSGREPVAFRVDTLLGRQEVVVRPVRDPLVHVPGVSGSADLGDGAPVLVLDLPGLGARPAAQEGVR